MGPVWITVSRWTLAATSRTDGADVWSWMATIGGSMILRGHHRGAGAPLERCKADAIAAVEAWRDSIVVDGKTSRPAP